MGMFFNFNFGFGFGSGGFKPAYDGGGSASVGISEAIWFMDIEKSIPIARKNSTRIHEGALMFLTNFGSIGSVP